MSKVVRLTDKNFEDEVLQSDVPVLVDFWASWCPPCKMVEPVMEELAVEWEGQVKVGKLNVDQNPRVSQAYRVLGVPTFTLFQAGEVLEHRVGAHSRDQLVRIISEALST